MTTVSNNPIRGASGDEDMDDPMGVNTFKGFSEIRKEDTIGTHGVVQKVLDIQVIKLRFTKDVEECLSRMEST